MKLLLIKMGATMPLVKTKFGDYEEWFERGLEKYGRFLDYVDAPSQPDWSSISRPDGCIISGSASSVYERAAWSELTAQKISCWQNEGVPILGVCYGHQLLAQTQGAKVTLNPAGREIGVCSVNQVGRDPLFNGLSECFNVVQTHSDAVMTAVPGGRILAQNTNTSNQAMSVGNNVRSVQWHPEMTAEIIRLYIEMRRDEIVAESGARAVDDLMENLIPVDSGTIILRNFVEHFVMRTSR